MNDSKENSLVSIGLIAYNRAHYLPSVIDSWLAQTYQNFELIISNDASPDPRVHEICEEYAKKDERIKYIKQKNNLGVLRNQKLVLAQARGKYFAWSADDDLRDKRFLEDCLVVFEKDPKLIMVFADMADIDKNGVVVNHPDPAKYMPLGKSAYERLKAYILFHSEDGKHQLLLGLWKREAILDDILFGLRPEDDLLPNYYWGFDNYFVFRNLAKGPIGFAPQTRFFHRTRVVGAYRPPRPFLPRIFWSFYHRLGLIFGSPYFYYLARGIAAAKEPSAFEKLKLLWWNFFVMARLFFVRKI